MNMNKLIGFKTEKLNILTIKNEKANIIYLSKEYNDCPVSYMEKYNYWCIDLPDGDSVMINNALI